MRVRVTPEQVRQAFDNVKADRTFAESRQIVERGGLPVEMIQAMSLRPEMLDGLAALGKACYPGGLLPRRLKELVILQSSVDNACQFCTNSHVATIRNLGLGDEPLKLLEDPSALAPDERAALNYTKAAMADSNRVPEAVFARLREHFDDAGIVELTFLIGMINMLNLFNNCLQVTYRGDYGS